MSKIFTTILNIGITLPLLLVFWFTSVPDIAQAQTCDFNDTPGNLFGYIVTDNLGPIYVSTESWNAANPADPTNVSFYVNYNRHSRVWSGRAWNESVGWVNFEYDKGVQQDDGSFKKRARFVAPGTAYDDGTDEWGNWPGIIELDATMTVNGTSITPVRYSTNDKGGRFIGLGIDANLTGGGDPKDDEYVGSGILDFSNVNYVDSKCNENISILVGGETSPHRNCPISKPLIQWNSNNVENCEIVVVNGKSLWDVLTNDPYRNNENATGERADGDITLENTPVTFKLKCTGDKTGADIFGESTASCGESDPIPETGVIIPVFKEV